MTAVASFLCEGPEQEGSGRYGPHYLTNTGVSEDDEGFEDDLDLDISFEEVTKISAINTQVFCVCFFLLNKVIWPMGYGAFYIKLT